MSDETDQAPVVAAAPEDLDAVMRLLAEARAWHAQKGVDVWKEFDPAAIAVDIAAGRVFVAKAGGTIHGTITLVESDSLVWDAEPASAFYVHRLASSRDMAGRGIGAGLLRWARRFAAERRKECLRLETWDANRKMRDYYERQGFRHVRDKFFPMDGPAPADYRGTWKSLYELKLRDR